MRIIIFCRRVTCRHLLNHHVNRRRKNLRVNHRTNQMNCCECCLRMSQKNCRVNRRKNLMSCCVNRCMNRHGCFHRTNHGLSSACCPECGFQNLCLELRLDVLMDARPYWRLDARCLELRLDGRHRVHLQGAHHRAFLRFCLRELRFHGRLHGCSCFCLRELRLHGRHHGCSRLHG